MGGRFYKKKCFGQGRFQIDKYFLFDRFVSIVGVKLLQNKTQTSMISHTGSRTPFRPLICLHGLALLTVLGIIWSLLQLLCDISSRLRSTPKLCFDVPLCQVFVLLKC